MAIKQEIKDKIVAEYHIGKSQNWLAREYECSPATVNKLCKGLIPKYKEKVNDVVAIKSDLSRENEFLSECFDKEVNDKLRRANLVYGIQEKAIKKIGDMIENGKVEEKIGIGDGCQTFQERKMNPKDLKDAIEAVDRASITLGVNQRHASTLINNSNAQQNIENKQIDIVVEE